MNCDYETKCFSLQVHLADIQEKCAKLRAANDAFDVELPAIRTGATSAKSITLGADGKPTKPAARIKSTDYEQWDKYDAGKLDIQICPLKS